MNIVLWILQVLLAAVFAAHGWMLVSPPRSFCPSSTRSWESGSESFSAQRRSPAPSA
jgi:uncharacterized membrane protein YphA (DoxX/SURF4 family)